MASVIRLGSALCAGIALLLLPDTLRAQDPPTTLEPSSAFAADNVIAPANPIGVGVVQSPTGLETSATFLLLQASSGNMVYATTINPYPILQPHWGDQSVNPSFNPAFSVGMRYAFGGGEDMQLSWTSLNTFDHGSAFSANPASAPGIPPLSGPASTQTFGPPFLTGRHRRSPASSRCRILPTMPSIWTVGSPQCWQSCTVRPFAGLNRTHQSESHHQFSEFRRGL